MMHRFLGIAALAATLFAQTAAEQLQKGIFAQDTAGDLDGAIAVYREVLKSPQTPRSVAATAQFRLSTALALKGDTEGAAREYREFTAKFSDYRPQIEALQRRLLAGAVLSKRASLGIASDYQHYHHNATGADLVAPLGTSFLSDSPSSDDGQMVIFGGHQYSVSVWLKAEEHTPNELQALVRNDMEVKPMQRDQGWHVRPETVQTGVTANGVWLKAIANYEENGRPMVEVLTWYRTPHAHVLFGSRIAPAQLDDVEAKLAKMVSEAKIP